MPCSITLTRTQRRHILSCLAQQPALRLVDKLNQRMSGLYVLERDELEEALRTLRAALADDSLDGRSKLTLQDVLTELERHLPTSWDDPNPSR